MEVHSSFYSRWAALSTACIVASFAGTGYAIGLFTQAFKEILHLDQSEVDAVASAGNFGLFFSCFAGLFYNRFGPAKSLLIGATLVGVGFQLMHLSCAKRIAYQDWVSLAFFNFIAQHGSGWLASATVATSVRNFPGRDRGSCVGLTKGFFAISSGCIAQYYKGGFEPDTLAFLGFLSITVPIIAMLGSCIMNLIPESLRSSYSADAVPRPTWLPYYAVAGALFFWLLLSSALQEWVASGYRHCRENSARASSCREPSGFLPLLSMAGTLSLLVLLGLLPVGWFYGAAKVHSSHAPLNTNPIIHIELAPSGPHAHVPRATPATSELSLSSGSSNVDEKEHEVEAFVGERIARRRDIRANDADKSLTSDEVTITLAGCNDEGVCDNANGGSDDNDDNTPPLAVALEEIKMVEEESPSIGLSKVLRTLNFWMLFCVFGTLAGSGLVFINNVGQIILAQQKPPAPGAKAAAMAVSMAAGSKDSLVTIISACNFLGRLGGGVLSDKCGGARNRPCFLAFWCLVMGLAHCTLAADALSLWVVAAMVGTA